VATLLCCVLPSLLVLFGLGTTVAALTSALPWLVTLSRHKGWVFLAAGIFIVVSRLYQTRLAPRVRVEGAACPTPLGRWTNRIWWLSVVLYACGVAAVYVVGPLLLASGR
jgi:type II secretory pathway component PulF